MPYTLDKSITTELSKQLRAEYKAGLDYRYQREKAWKEAEDQYFNKQKKSLKNRYNVPIPIVPGFVETLLSKVDNPPTLKFKEGEEADYKAAQKANAFYQQESQAEDHDWDLIDLDTKKLAIMSGRGINKYYAESYDGYKSCLEVVDHYDFIADPIGGGNLEKHRFVMQDNLFKNKADLKTGVEQGMYDAKAVSDLINATKDDALVDNDNTYRSKQNRMIALGLDGITYNYAGQALYKLIEAGTTYNGKRYWCAFNYETGIVVRAIPLEEVFKSKLWPWTSWATHRDVFNFWSKSPLDDVLPLADMARILLNQELDNRLKRNFGQRAYDPDVFPNPAELIWGPDKLVAVKTGTSKVQEIGRGIYSFETPELKGTIDLVQYLDNVIKEKSGVNSEAQGQSDQTKVGIAYLNVQQAADRVGLLNKSYRKNWAAIGRRFVWGLFEHLRSPQAIQMIGEKGAEWDEITRLEIKPDWNIIVEGGDVEMQEDAIKQKQLVETFATLTPDELAVTSPRWRAEAKLRAAGVDEEQLRLAFDLTSDGNREILSEASMAIQEILKGKQPKLNRGANTAFVQKIMDYAFDADDLKDGQFEALIQYAEQHLPIAAENMARKAVAVQASRGIAPSAMATPQPSPSEQLMQMDQPANTPGGTQSTSQDMTNMAPQASQV